MANAITLTNENAINRADYIQKALANSVLRLLIDFTPIPTTNRAALLSNEANFTGYTAGGYALTAWDGPGFVSGTGALLTAPTIQVTPAGNNTITNNLTGGWVEQPNLSGTLNVTLLTFVLNPPVPVYSSLDQFPLTIQDVEGLVVPPTLP